MKLPLRPSASIATEQERYWPRTASAYNQTWITLRDAAMNALPHAQKSSEEYAASKGNRKPPIPTWQQMKNTKDENGEKYIPNAMAMSNMLGNEWAENNPMLQLHPDTNRHMQQQAIKEAITAFGLRWDSIRDARIKFSKKIRAKKTPNKRCRSTASKPLYDIDSYLKDIDNILESRASGENIRLTIGCSSKSALKIIDEGSLQITPIKNRNGKPLTIRTRHAIPVHLADQIAGWRLVETTKKTTRQTKPSDRRYELHLQIRLTPPTQEADPLSKPLGIDRGVNNTIATSNDIFINRKKEDNTQAKQMQGYQSKRLTNGSRKHKQIARQRQAMIRKQNNKRTDWENKTANKLARGDNTSLISEDLSLKNMTSSAAGGRKRKGQRVSSKTSLNESLSQAALSRLAEKTANNFEARGKETYKVPSAYTSMTCIECGTANNLSRGKGKNITSFKCVKCGADHNADTQAAKNIIMSKLEPQWPLQIDTAAGQEQSVIAVPSHKCGSVVVRAKRLPQTANPNSAEETDYQHLTPSEASRGMGYETATGRLRKATYLSVAKDAAGERPNGSDAEDLRYQGSERSLARSSSTARKNIQDILTGVAAESKGR